MKPHFHHEDDLEGGNTFPTILGYLTDFFFVVRIGLIYDDGGELDPTCAYEPGVSRYCPKPNTEEVADADSGWV